MEVVYVFGMMGGRMDFEQFASITETFDIEDPLLMLSLLNVVATRVGVRL